MGELQLHGMKAASTRSWPTPSSDPQPIIGDLLATEISEKQARSIKYQFTIAKLPLAKGLDDFQFEAYRSTRPSCAISPTAASSHSSVMLYCRGTGKTHLAIAIARSCIRAGAVLGRQPVEWIDDILV